VRRSRSNIISLQKEGNKLYTILIGGVASWLTTDRQLVIEADDDIEGVPLDALVDQEGEYLAQHYTLVWSPGLYYTDALRLDGGFSRRSRALVVGSATVDGKDDERFVPCPMRQERRKP